MVYIELRDTEVIFHGLLDVVITKDIKNRAEGRAWAARFYPNVEVREV